MIGGVTRGVEDGINRWNSGGQPGVFGLASNAKMTGLFENFQGKVFSVFNAGGPSLTYSRTMIITVPHILSGASQYLVAYASAAAVQAGFPDADTNVVTTYGDGALIVGQTYTILTVGDSDFTTVGAATNTVGVTFVATGAGNGAKTGTVTHTFVSPKTGRGLFRMNLLQTTAGKQAISLLQGNALWIPGASSFKAFFDINLLTNPTQAKAVSFAEVGVVGTQGTLFNSTDAAKEIGDGNPFIQIQFAASKAKLRVRTAASATILESAAFDYPLNSPFTVGIEYNKGAVGNILVRLNDRQVVTLQATVTGPFQAYARACHGASYVVANHTQKVLELDTVAVTVPTAE